MVITELFLFLFSIRNARPAVSSRYIEHNSYVYLGIVSRNPTFVASSTHDGERRGDHRGRSRVHDGDGRWESHEKTKEGKATLGKQTVRRDTKGGEECTKVQNGGERLTDSEKEKRL